MVGMDWSRAGVSLPFPRWAKAVDRMEYTKQVSEKKIAFEKERSWTLTNS